MSDLNALSDLAPQIRAPEFEHLVAVARQRNRRSMLAAALAVLVVIALFTLSNPLTGARHRTIPARLPADPTRFAGLPPVGAQLSLPVQGPMVLDVSPESGWTWNVYADGHIIWQRWSDAGDPLVIPQGADPSQTAYVQQQLTPDGVHLLLSKVLATGQRADLFRHSQTYGNAAMDSASVGWYQVCSGGDLIHSQVLNPTNISEKDPLETPAQARALAQIVTLMRDATTQLPGSAWADRTIRPYLPSHYVLKWERSAPDPSKMPSPAKEVLQPLLQPILEQAEGSITTDQARALLTAFAQSGSEVVNNHAAELDFKVPALHRSTTVLEILPDITSSAPEGAPC